MKAGVHRTDQSLYQAGADTDSPPHVQYHTFSLLLILGHSLPNNALSQAFPIMNVLC